MKKKQIKARSVFISDVHLGTKHCQAEKLLEFLKSIECEKLYLVGDILDIWAMRSKGVYWTPEMNRIVSRIIKLSRIIDVVYVTGNHDEFIRQFAPIELGFIDVCNRKTHYTKDGKKLLVIHGDIFDPIVCKYKWIAKLGGRAYELLITLNGVVNKGRRLLKLPHWSLSKYVKHKAKSVTGIIDNFQGLMLDYAKEKGFDGVVAGHIHTASVNNPEGYYNCGDWVESCTALIEDKRGNFSLFEFDTDA